MSNATTTGIGLQPGVAISNEEHQQVVTEGQLKWAQFHYKRRAKQVRQQVEELLQTPASVEDVEGALSDDGNTTEESVWSEEEEAQKQQTANRKPSKRQKKVSKQSISRGRRALLRVSKRAFAKRQEEIQTYGYQNCCEDDIDDDEDLLDEDRDDLAAKFADETAWKKAKRNRRQSRRRRRAKNSTQQRLLQFEEAFRAMMMSLAALQPQQTEIATPTKVWSRPEDAPAFVSIDGRQYQDLKWGVSAETGKLLTTTTHFSSVPVDTQASWLVHIPARQQERGTGHHQLSINSNGEVLVPENVNGTFSERMIPVSMGSDKFQEIKDTLQNQASLSQQQMEEQMEIYNKHRNNPFKWQVTNPSGYEGHAEDDDDEYDDSLDPENLKTIAAQYLTEFMASADEEHLIAALGEKYKDDVETLVASSDGGGNGSTSDDDSKDIVRRYIQGLQASSNDEEPSNDDNRANATNKQRDQMMSSFAGIAARYLAEVSRPRKIEPTVNIYRHEQGILVQELASLMEHLIGMKAADDDTADALASSSEPNERIFQSILAKYLAATDFAAAPDCPVKEADVLQELNGKEGHEFSRLMTRYLAKVHSAMLKKRTNTGKSRRSSIANRYMEMLGKKSPLGNDSAGTDTQENIPTTSNDQHVFERICCKYFEELNDVADNQGENNFEEADVLEELRQEKHKAIPAIVASYLRALSQSIASGEGGIPHHTNDIMPKPIADRIQAIEEVFSQTLPIFDQLGPSHENQRSKQRLLEAFASRFIANIAQCNEDTLFVELGEMERQGFSRLATCYLDEILEASIGWRADQREKAIVTRYFADLELSQRFQTKATPIQSRLVEDFLCRYMEEVYSLSKDQAQAALRKSETTNFSTAVAKYLANAGDSVREQAARSNTIVEQGLVADILDDLEHTDEGGGNPVVAMPPQNLVTGMPRSRRSVGRAEGVAARYISAVVDDCDDDDIFAELRKQDSPKLDTVGEDVFSELRGDSPRSGMETPGINQQLSGTRTPQRDSDNASASNRDGAHCASLTNASSLQSTALHYISKLRIDCSKQDISAAMGNLENREEDRAIFANGVTSLLLGVSESTVRGGRSRASASRYLAAMRGLVDEHEEPDKALGSLDVDEAAEMLSESVNMGDQKTITWAIQKLGKTESKNFANLISAYLSGDLSRIDFDLIQKDVVESSTKPEAKKLESTEVKSDVGSDFFAYMRRHKIFPQEVPKREQDPPAPANSRVLEGERNRQNPGSDEVVAAEGNVLQNTVDRFSNRRDSYQQELAEEKKAADHLSRSSSSEKSGTMLSDREDENTPFVVEDGSSQFETPNRFQSPDRSQAPGSEFSPERLRDFHQSVIQKSALIGDGEAVHPIIDTDGTTSEASDSGAALSPKAMAGLMLSPTILNKRLTQAILAIKSKRWEQVSYLLNANPWLAEMPEIGTNQYLLHKIASFGGGNSADPPAPEQLCGDMVKMYSAVQKFDNAGNLPLHMASSSGNVRMIAVLGERFPSGASVRNEDGMLPIHLAIASRSKARNSMVSLVDVIKPLLAFFPGALAIADNAGNLPLHVAAQCLNGDEGVDVINLLLDEAEKQIRSPGGVRFRNKVTIDEEDNESVSTGATTSKHMLEEGDNEEDLPPSMVVNDDGDIPLWLAISRSAPEVVKALVIGPGGRQSAFRKDLKGNTSLHRLLNQNSVSMVTLKAILDAVPEVALETNNDRLLPIEMAAMNSLPSPVVLELLLADLPILLHDKACLTPKGGGRSWWFLTCDNDDRYLDVVEKLVSMCTYQQVNELAFVTDNASNETLISRTSPECGEFLTVSLLFVGRFEFLAFKPDQVWKDCKVYDALDYGSAESPNEEGRRVMLKCFTSEETYKKEISILRNLGLDFNYVEQISCFMVGARDSYDSGGCDQFCIAVEQPSLTLDRVVAGMLRNDACRENSELRRKYIAKILSVLRVVAKGLYNLHSAGIVHGNLVPEACGKFGDRWKLVGAFGFQRVGKAFDAKRFGESVPPEALEPHNIAVGGQVAFRTGLAVDRSIDIWGFGKLSYDVLVGQALIDFDQGKELHNDHTSLLRIQHWSTLDLVEVRQDLRRVGVPDPVVLLITRCLSQDPGNRPSTMNEILRSDVWDNLHRPAPAPVDPSHLHEC
ncbi:expressed unknown protein [Seminavis robusta]|uniref:Protein kinase domain-containing protein n=1 Tax=Seminavis robusta TaxID=568900 RepID=A0A9N8H4X0_9STRA|nr:expressed unknown protein [Seminavis robusta]|eukprot:Sro125_g060360.1 n/a (2137) ;mRNA; f:86838-93417